MYVRIKNVQMVQINFQIRLNDTFLSLEIPSFVIFSCHLRREKQCPTNQFLSLGLIRKLIWTFFVLRP